MLRRLIILGAAASLLLIGAFALQSTPFSNLQRQSPATSDFFSQQPELVTAVGPVVNANGALDPFTLHLRNMAQGWQKELGIELQIISADLLEQVESAGAGEDFARFTAKLFQARGVGEEQVNGGILILLDGAGERARIEVSYELEQAFPDAFVGRLAEQQLVPYMGAKITGMAAQDIIQFLKDFALLQAAADNLPNSSWARRSGEYRNKMAYLTGGAGASVMVEELMEGLLNQRDLTAEELAAYDPDPDLNKTIEKVLSLWRNQISNHDLAIYTPGSRVLFDFYPYAPFQVAERLARLERSGELITTVEGDRAVVTFSDPVHGSMPILFHRMNGLWRLDEAETLKNMFFDHQGNYFQRNNNHPYEFGLMSYGRGAHFDIAAIPLEAGSLQETIDQLRDRDDALAHFELAELLFRNAWVVVGAWDDYEKAVELAPGDPLYRATLVDRYLYTFMFDPAITHLEQMGPSHSLTLARAYAMTENWAGTEKAARTALAENPYSSEALDWLGRARREQGLSDSDTRTQARSLKSDVKERFHAIELSFRPDQPVYHLGSSIEVDGKTLYGYSELDITITNPSKRPVIIEAVTLERHGSGVEALGDIRDYWAWPTSARELGPGEKKQFSRTFGRSAPVGDQRISYRFRSCWRGLREDLQCHIQWLHLNSTASVLRPVVME